MTNMHMKGKRSLPSSDIYVKQKMIYSKSDAAGRACKYVIV